MCITLWKTPTTSQLSSLNSEIFTTMHRTKCGIKERHGQKTALQFARSMVVVTTVRSEVAIVLVWRGEIAARQTALPTRARVLAGARPSAHPCRPSVCQPAKGLKGRGERRRGRHHPN